MGDSKTFGIPEAKGLKAPRIQCLTYRKRVKIQGKVQLGVKLVRISIILHQVYSA